MMPLGSSSQSFWVQHFLRGFENHPRELPQPHPARTHSAQNMYPPFVLKQFVHREDRIVRELCVLSTHINFTLSKLGFGQSH